MQIPAIRKAKAMGLFVIATDKNPSAPGFEFADKHIVLDTKDVAGHVNFALHNKEKLNIAGAFAGADVAVTVAAITEALGLPGISLDVARRSNNKWLMKQRWLKDRIPTPYAEEVQSLKEAKQVLKRLGLPAMVKAIDNAASRGSRKISTMGDLEDAILDARRHSTTDTALIEEYVQGPEQSVEYIAYSDMHYRFGMVDRHFGFEPFPIEIGHTNPSKLFEEIQESLYALVKNAAVSLGIDFGPYKADTILTTTGPMVLELPARLSGGFHSQYTTPLATGMDPINAALHIAIGEKFPVKDAQAKYKREAVCKAIFPQPGKIVKIEGIEDARKLLGVEEIFLMVKEGDTILPYRNCSNRICYIITSGSQHEEAEKNWQKAAGTIKIYTEPLRSEGNCDITG
jgi:biotin carboxylase